MVERAPADLGATGEKGAGAEARNSMRVLDWGSCGDLGPSEVMGEKLEC